MARRGRDADGQHGHGYETGANRPNSLEHG
jgi:hypothetical protein